MELVMVAPTIDVPRQAIAEFCARHGIRRLSLFGSVLRNDFRPDSDVDVLVEFQPGRIVGWNIVEIEDELSRLFGGHKVDMVNPKYLNPRLKERILASAQVQYDEG
jgi:predicted nucleotidyltransferase